MRYMTSLCELKKIANMKLYDFSFGDFVRSYRINEESSLKCKSNINEKIIKG